MNRRRVLLLVLNGSRNVRFADFVDLVEGFGFQLDRVSGSHHIFKRSGVQELLNLQNVGGQAKPYQMRQFATLIERYHLELPDEER